jgi:hypothetical protein
VTSLLLSGGRRQAHSKTYQTHLQEFSAADAISLSDALHIAIERN